MKSATINAIRCKLRVLELDNHIWLKSKSLINDIQHGAQRRYSSDDSALSIKVCSLNTGERLYFMFDARGVRPFALSRSECTRHSPILTSVRRENTVEVEQLIQLAGEKECSRRRRAKKLLQSRDK